LDSDLKAGSNPKIETEFTGSKHKWAEHPQQQSDLSIVSVRTIDLHQSWGQAIQTDDEDYDGEFEDGISQECQHPLPLALHKVSRPQSPPQAEPDLALLASWARQELCALFQNSTLLKRVTGSLSTSWPAWSAGKTLRLSYQQMVARVQAGLSQLCWTRNMYPSLWLHLSSFLRINFEVQKKRKLLPSSLQPKLSILVDPNSVQTSNSSLFS